MNTYQSSTHTRTDIEKAFSDISSKMSFLNSMLGKSVPSFDEEGDSTSRLHIPIGAGLLASKVGDSATIADPEVGGLSLFGALGGGLQVAWDSPTDAIPPKDILTTFFFFLKVLIVFGIVLLVVHLVINVCGGRIS